MTWKLVHGAAALINAVWLFVLFADLSDDGNLNLEVRLQPETVSAGLVLFVVAWWGLSAVSAVRAALAECDL